MAEPTGAKVVSLDLNDPADGLAEEVATKATIEDKGPAENVDVDGMPFLLTHFASRQWCLKTAEDQLSFQAILNTRKNLVLSENTFNFVDFLCLVLVGFGSDYPPAASLPFSTLFPSSCRPMSPTRLLC